MGVFEYFRDLLTVEVDVGGGERDRRPFMLEPWQQFIIGSLFGWYRDDLYRRFRTAYIEVGKGSGKSAMAAGICLYGLVADGECVFR